MCFGFGLNCLSMIHRTKERVDTTSMNQYYRPILGMAHDAHENLINIGSETETGTEEFQRDNMNCLQSP